MKNTILLTLLLVVFAGCGKSSGKKEIVILNNIEPVPGKHCESSAVVNALKYQGYDIDETLLTGAGAVPSFVYKRSGFPFIGGRSLYFKEFAFLNLGIEWTLRQPGNKNSEWEKIISLLQNDYPVILRVDMKYLRYLWNGKYGYSFGWHIITLFGVDEEKGIAFVTDTTLPGLQEIKLKDLAKARKSDLDLFPPENEYYWIEKTQDDYSYNLETVVKNSVKQVLINLEIKNGSPDELAGIDGIKKLSTEIINIEDTVKSYMLEPVFDFLFGSIETNGTGGALFRNFYGDFLKTSAKSLNDPDLAKAAELTYECAEGWKLLASEFKSISREIKSIKKPETRDQRYMGAAKMANDVYEKEMVLYGYLRDLTVKWDS